MFPGDIQKARAITSIEASPFVFLENTLVFSSKGERPLQDMLGGGDLDGDEASLPSKSLLHYIHILFAT